MKNLLVVICFIFFLSSCDDGDIVVTSFDFTDQTLERCNDFEYVFFKINPDNNESIALQFATTQNFLEDIDQIEVTLSGSDQVVYRRFNTEVASSYFCNAIPPTEPSVAEELTSTTGLITITTTATEADDDGIPSAIEDPDGTLDTDGDGLVNSLDFDDDGDNVPTILEGVVLNSDGTIDVELSRDTDEDGILDYLDDDDDNDGVLTRDEDANEDLDPSNDNSDITSTLDDYLNPAIAVTTEINEYREHTYFLNDIVVFIDASLLQFFNDAGEEVVTLERDLPFGEYTGSPSVSKTITPDFN